MKRSIFSRVLIGSLCLIIGVRLVPAGNKPQGFFLEGQTAKIAPQLSYIDVTLTKSKPTVTISVDFADTITQIPGYIFGNNANVYMSQMVNEPQLLDYIRQLSPNVLRYPGGNLSNVFFWNHRPGELPEGVPNPLFSGVEKPYREQFWYGRSDSVNNLAVENYYKMLDMTHSTGLICVNYSFARYGTTPDPVAAAAHYAADWVRYDHGRTKFWEIGNENFGKWQAGYKIDTTANKDSQPAIITGELYGRHFRVFADSMRAAARAMGVEIKIGAGLLESARDWHTPTEKTWNSGFFAQAGDAADFFVIHSYYTPWNENSTAATILNSAIPGTREMMEFMQETARTNHVAMKPVGLTEWNIFAVGSKQAVSYINGIHAALVLGESIRNRYAITCRWDLANKWEDGNDHGMFSQGDEPGVPRWNPRPVFYYMTYFQRFCGDYMVNSKVAGSDDIVAYATMFGSGEAGLILINKGGQKQTVELQLGNYRTGKRCYWYLLTGGNDNGDFSRQVFINGKGPDLVAGGPANFNEIKANSAKCQSPLIFELPPYAVQYLLIDNASQGR
jgi:hypothetical protein